MHEVANDPVIRIVHCFVAGLLVAILAQPSPQVQGRTKLQTMI